LAIDGHFDGQGGMAGKDFDKEAFSIRREMRDDHESHAWIGGHGGKKPLKSAKAACGCPDADNRKA
jgi:hypothetical protein